VCRLDPTYASTKKKKIKLLATEYGNPRAGARIVMQITVPPPALVTGLSTDPSAVTASNGWATVELRADATVDPAGQQRDFMHSGIFKVRCALDQTNLSDTITVLVWELFKPKAGGTTWLGTVQQIFQPYAVLFPFMKNIVDLSDYNQVCAKRFDIIEVLSLSDEDPHYMPVTRDLAPSRRKAILKWLNHLGPDGNPLLGTPN
jgi:collagen type VI alpha